MLKVVIAALNSKYIHSSLSPWYLAAGIRAYSGEDAQCIDVQVVEGTVNEAMEAVVERILKQEPDVVGLSCYIWNIRAMFTLVSKLKTLRPQLIVVLGGPEVSYNAKDVMAGETPIDYILSGEGERPFAELAVCLLHQKQPYSIPGLCYRKDAEILENPPHSTRSDPPNPYTEDYFKALRGRIAYVETSRGCPYSCAFCLSGRCGGVRFFDLPQTLDRLVQLANSTAKTIKLVDRTFNANRQRAKAIFRFLLEQYGTAIPKDVCFHFEIAGDLLDGETLSILREAPPGYFQLEVGLQSFHAPTLEAIHRKTNVEKLLCNLRQLLQAGNVHTHIDLIAGLPLEGYATFADSFNTAYSLRPHMLQLGFLKLLHGAPMREQLEDYPCSYAPHPPYEVIQTPWLTVDDLERLHALEDALDRLYNSGRFHRTLDYVLAQTNLTPFRLLEDFGLYVAAQETPPQSLDAYTAFVWAYCHTLRSVDKEGLYNAMVCDRLATNASGRLPAILRQQRARGDKSLKRAVNTLAEQGIRLLDSPARGLALLSDNRTLVYADYTEKHPVTDEYPLQTYVVERQSAAD